MNLHERIIGKLSDYNPIWEALTKEETKRASSCIEIAHYHKDDVIHREGDLPQSVMMLVSGRVKIIKQGIGGQLQIIRLLKPGDLFSYRALVADEHYTLSAIAFEPCMVYRLDKDTFFDLLQHNAHFCFRVMQTMAVDLALQESRTINLTQKHLRGRLAESLLLLKDECGLEPDKQTLSMYISRQDLAYLSNMTTSNAIRTLSQFAQEGLVYIDGRHIRLLDIDELMHISRLG